MGIFADKCQALIDPATGRALTGEAMKQLMAKEDRKWIKTAPRCGNTVKKAAKFCNKCGTPAPKGWWRCPHCKKVVGNDSEYCWNCSAQLHPESRVNIAGGVWDKEASTFAQRFEIGDIKSMLKKDLQIQAGTTALMMDGGKYKGHISAGQYDPDSFLRKINHFGTPPPRSVILIDAGDVILPVRMGDLRSSEGMELEFYGEIVLRFNPKKAQEFIENRFKDNIELSYQSLSDLLEHELRHAVEAMCTTSTIDDLIRDPERRIRLQDEMSATLKVTLDRSGIDLIHLSSAEFSGDAYEELLEQQGENERKRREIEYQKQMRDMLSQETMEKFKTEQDLKEYQELLTHEYGISAMQREREEKVLLRGWQHQDELDDLRQRIKLEDESVTARIHVDEMKGDHTRSEQVKNAEAAAQARSATFGQEAAETEQALKWRREKNDIHADAKDRDAKRRNGLNDLQLLADVEDPQQRQQLMELVKLKLQQGLSPEQVLAFAAEASPAAADALARMKEAESGHDREVLKEMKTLYKDTQDLQYKNLEAMLKPVTEAAKKEVGDTHIHE